MQGQVLYAPVITSEQRRASNIHRKFFPKVVTEKVPLRKIVTEIKPIATKKRPAKPAPVVEAAPGDEWVERQKALWFGVVEDLGPIEPKAIQIPEIQAAVARFYSLSSEEFHSLRRTVPLVVPRQIAMYLAKTLTNRSFPDIGRRFGKDHTTILHAVRKIERLVETNPSIANDVRVLHAQLCVRLPASPAEQGA